MSSALIEDVELLRAGLAGDEPEIEVTLRLPRESAKKVLTLLDAEQTTGAFVVPAKQEAHHDRSGEDSRDVAADADADDRPG